MATNVGNSMGGWIGGLAANTTTATTVATPYGQQGVVYTGYPTSQPVPITADPYIRSVTVIPESYPEPLHFQTSDGKIHSFSVDEVWKKLGLKW